jgi:class 3 adenylate cyclase/tetratricopeptide (TPR) repeat protein
VVAAIGGEERKLVSVVFADVTGSTTLGEQLDPERFREVMQAYASAMREEIEAEGGTVEKFIGDAVMAAFGVPAAHEDDAERALRASLRMLRRLDDLNGELRSSHDVALQIRIGVNTGEVLAVTAPDPGEAMVTGDAVNAAARLQSAADPGSALVSERTTRSARGFAFEDRGELALKGKQERVRAFRLLEETGSGSRGVPGLTAPMVGRDTELDLLRSVYERVARERRPHLVTLYGDAGVGKSRLTREFLAGAERADPSPLVLAGRCLPYGDGVTYWPLAEILKGHAGILDTDPPELAVEKVRKTGRDLLTQELAADPARATAALAYTVGLVDPEVSFEGENPRDVRDELHRAWTSFFTALARVGPVIVVIEDIHWADPSLLDLLSEMAERVEGPVTFLCPSRPDLTATRPDWGGGRRNMSSIALDPLSADDAEHLVRLLLTVDDLPPSVLARILERAEGNPFYLEEIVRRLIDGRLLERRGERWVAATGIEEVEIPDTVQAVLASRIDLLDPSDKRVLQAASVVGRVFWIGPVSELTGIDPAELGDALRRMEDRELVLSRPGSALAGQREYLFKHILTRDVAYESLPRRDRAEAHTSAAHWLERTSGDRAGEFAELLAYHYSTAVSLGRESGAVPDDALRHAAWSWLIRASIAARLRLVIRKAERAAEEALRLSANDLERTDALETLADAFFQTADGDLAWRYYRDAARIRAGAPPEDHRRVAYLASRAADVRLRWPGSMRGTPPSEAETRAMMDLGFGHLPPGDSEERVRMLSLQAAWAFAFPDPRRTETDLETLAAAGTEAAVIAARIGRPDLASAALDNAQGAWASVGNYARSLVLWNDRGRVIGDVSDLLEIGDFHAMGGWAYYELGDLPRSLGSVETGIALVAGRAPNVESHLRSWRCVTLFRIGRWDEAVHEYEVTRALLDDRRDEPPYFAAHAYATAAICFHARDQQVLSDRVTDLLLGLPTVGPRLYPTLLRLLVRRDDLEGAARLRRPDGWAVHRGDALESESELLAARGAWAEAVAFATEMRAQATLNGTTIVSTFADRLEGRAAAAGGESARAVELLTRAAARFDELGAVWERALTEADLAAALTSLDRPDEARAVRARARATFEHLGAVTDLAALEER